MSEIFNNREIAIAVWLGIILIWSLSKSKMRLAINNVVKSALANKLVAVYFLLGLITSMLCYLLNLVGLWDLGQLKNTIYWYLGVALVSIFQITKDIEHPTYFNDLVLSSFKFIVLIEFIIAFYTFDLWLELIFVPILFIIGVLVAYSSLKTEYAATKKILNQLLVIVGSGLIIFTICKLITEFNEFAQINTVYDYSTPVLLSILFTPFLFMFHRYVAYENINIRLQYIIKDQLLRSHTKKLFFLKLHWNPQKLILWSQLNQNKTIQSKDDVQESIQNVITYLRDKANPPKVDRAFGWSSFKAQYFLNEFELTTGVYKNIYDDVWHASSQVIDLGGQPLPNNIGYYIEGSKESVKSLKLVVNIGNEEAMKPSIKKFTEISSHLFFEALERSLPLEIEKALIQAKSYSERYENQLVSVEREDWPNHNGYRLKLAIECQRDG